MDTLIQRYGVLRHTYRNTPLYLTDEQKLKLERIFGITRVLRNRLMSCFKEQHFDTMLQAYHTLQPEAQLACQQVLDYITPAEQILVDSEVHAVISDLMEVRYQARDDFVSNRHIQTAWIMDPFHCQLEQDRFEVPGFTRGIKLPASRMHHPGHPVTARIVKHPSHYQLSLLYEEKATTRHPYQDTRTTELGLRILQDQAEPSQTEGLADYHPAWIWRKQILDRLMRQLVRRRQSELEPVE